MTFSLLVRDPATGSLGGATATGSLCVGGWVLRGDSRQGMSASQGASPSTLWGEEVLEAMAQGIRAEQAVGQVTGRDAGNAWRQLAALDPAGGVAAFTGGKNTDWRGARTGQDVVAAGNLLAGPEVLEAMMDAFADAGGGLAERLLAALWAAEAAGGDSRGLQSAALLVVQPDAAPLTLRVDWSETPLADLAALHHRTRETPYAAWLRTLPTLEDPFRGQG